MIDASEQIGRHNAHIEGSARRIEQGGSWKKQRIVVIMPSANLIHAKIYLAHTSLIYPPNQAVYRVLALGKEVGQAFSDAIANVLAHPELSTWEYILTIEHDNAPPADGVLKLLARMEQHPELACIGGLYWTKGEGGVPQIWGDPGDPILNFRPQVPKPGQLVECCGTGMGFNLWRIAAFKKDWAKLPKPLFKTKCSPEEGVGTQDLAFWAEAKKIGWRCAIDCGVLVSHIDPKTGFAW